MVSIRFLLICVLFSACIGFADTPKIPADLRDDYFERAQVWHPVPISKMRILQGPKSRISVPPEATVTCTYVEPKEQPGGTIPKFKCTLPSGDLIRVKYGQNEGEVYAEVAASRLLWALGFYADNDYPVKIRCLKCPEKDPFKPTKEEKRVTRMIPYAMMEEDFSGQSIEKSEDQGWDWIELSKVKEKSGGATAAQIEAFKLLAVFIQHVDDKHDNQRLACFKSDVVVKKGTAECRKPVLMIADAGSTFGSSVGGIVNTSGKMNLANWKKTDIWNFDKEHDYMQHDKKVCIGNLADTKEAVNKGLFDPLIAEEGRKFLADLLNQLTTNQIRDLFRVTGVDRINDYIEENGVRKKVTVDDWTSAFIKKRDQINERHCPTLAELVAMPTD